MKKFWEIKNKVDEDTAEMMIYGEISDETWLGDEVTPKQFAEDLKQCNGKALNVRVNSPGGDVFAAQAIYNQLKSYSGNITVRIDGMCASAATIISCAGNKVIMPDNAVFMIHNPKSALLGYYDAVDLSKMSDQLNTVKQTIVNVYKKRCQDSLPENKINKMMDAETWMSAKEAKDNGFIDEIDDAFKVKNSLKDDEIIVNSVSCSLKRFKNAEKLQEILFKNQEKPLKEGKYMDTNANDSNDFMEKLKNLLGIGEQPNNTTPAVPPPTNTVDDSVRAERQRMIDLDAMDDKSNPAITRIINTAKMNGSKPEDVKVFVDAVKGEKKQENVLDAIKNLITDQINSGADGVNPGAADNKDVQAKATIKRQQADEIVNMINGMRGEK